MENANRELSDSVSQTTIFETIVKEAGEFYKMMTTVATAFLGALLLLVDKHVDYRAWWAILCVFLGAAGLIASISFVAFVRLNNLESGRYALEGNMKKAAEIDRGKERLSKWAVWSLAAGMGFVCASVALDYIL